jgi:Ca2+-binding RTX toxin-like protein
MKSFNIEISDIQFLQEQNSSPIIHIIRYNTNGQAVYGFTRPVNNSHGLAGLDVELGLLGTFNVMTSEWAEYIPGNSPGVIINNITSGFGLRNVSGLFNNLGNPSSYDWGAIDHAFTRLSNSDYNHDVHQNSTNPAFNGQIKVSFAEQQYVNTLATTSWQNLTALEKALVQDSNWSQVIDPVTHSVDNAKRYANPFLTVADYTPRLISQLVDSSVAGSISGVPVQSAMDRIEALAPGTITDHTTYVKNGVTVNENFQRNANTLGGDPSLTGWNTLFGQFFDHGLDSIGKGGNKVNPNGPGAKIIVPLATDDPLYNDNPALGSIVKTLSISRATVSNPQQAGADGMFRTADDILSPGVDGIYGNADDVMGPTNPEYVNHVSPFIDQSQTYGSSEDVTNLLREWVKDPTTGQYVLGMKLLDGNSLANSWTLNNPDGSIVQTKQTLPTINELRAYLLATGRDDLSWEDIGNYRVRDAHGKVLDRDPGTAGVQTVSTGDALLLDMLPRLDAAHLLTDPLVGTASHVNLLASFNAAHIDRGSDTVSSSGVYISDYVNLQSGKPTALGATNEVLVSEILLRSISDHYIAGDGRVNENFGLTAVHHVWHEDHNWQIDNLINSIEQQQIADPTKTIAHAWQNMVAAVVGDVLTTGVTNVSGHYQDVKGNYVDKAGKINWNQEKMFQSATLIVQMEYQHVAIDQYARGMSPNIPLFVLYDSAVNPDVSLEYSQSAYRFGHSQLRETIDTLDPNGSLSGMVKKFALEQAFLNPKGFAANGPTAIAQGMTRQVSSEIDEILTPALQQSLLGQPQDLAAINIMRGRDLGIPTLNNLRRNLSNGIAADLVTLQQKLIANPGDTVLQEKIDKTISLQLGLTPYISWNDFGKNLIHPESLVNFLAAYAFDGNLDKSSMVVKLGHGGTIASLNGAETLAYQSLGWNDIAGNANNARTQALKFLGASSAADKSFENVDAWVGGLAEKHVYLGQLGSTFDAIFSDQMARLINGDRFYYFWRLQLGLPEFTQLIDSVTTEQFKDVIERTTGAQHLTGDVFYMTDSHIELGEDPTTRVIPGDITSALKNGNATIDAATHRYGDIVAANSTTANIDGTTGIGVYSDFGYDSSTDGQLINVNLVDYGVANRTFIQDTRPDLGVNNNPDGTPAYGFNSHETIAGTRFSDYLDAGDGDDTEYGEDGNDILIGNAGADHLYGGGGNDYLSGGTLPDFLDGGDGNDEIHGGDDADVLIGGDGNDSIYGESFVDELHGNNGDDYLNAGSDADFIFGGYGNDFILGEEGLDTEYGEWGDDQMFGGAGPDQLFGGQGDDILHGGSGGNNRNLNVDECLGEEGFNISSYSELLVKLDVIGDLNFQNINPVGSTALQSAPFGQLLVNIQGLEGTGFDDQLIGDAGDNWLIGGGGNDIMSGGAGDDVIIGDRVRLDILDGKYTGNVLGSGLLNLVSSGGGKHFTDLLKSYKDFEFGKDAGAIGANDIVTYTGALSNFTISTIKNADGSVLNDANNKPLGLRVIDNTGAETTGTGDLVIGADKLVFNYDFESIATSDATKAHTFINPTTLPTATTLAVSQFYRTVRNDFGNNEKADVLWRNTVTGETYLYQMNGSAVANEGSVRTVSNDWKIAGTGDFNSDKKSDILWRNTVTGETYLYQMNGSAVANESSVRTVSNDWKIAGTGDFNGDKKSDILWRNTVTGEAYIYHMNGSTISSEGLVRNVSNDWGVAGTGDFNGDGKSDILWRNANTGSTYLYLMNGTAVASEREIRQVTNDWVIKGVDDFDGDGKADILWRNTNNGDTYIYQMNGLVVAAEGLIGTLPTSNDYKQNYWNITGTGDYNGDGKADILWRHTNGTAYIWNMNGLNMIGEGVIRQVDSSWQVAAPTI